jgi:lysozyme
VADAVCLNNSPAGVENLEEGEGHVLVAGFERAAGHRRVLGEGLTVRPVPRRRVARVAVAVLVGLLAIGIAGAAGLRNGVLHLPYPSREDFPVQGIDVSNHQGSIDWARVRVAGYRFAYIKASEGKTFTDPDFATFAAGARAAGLRVGAYHYFTLCTPGADQARRFVAASGGPMPGDLPPVVDLEFGGNCSHRPSQADFDREYAAFDAAVTAAFGRPPVLYLTSDFAARYVDGAQRRGAVQADRQTWLRKILGRPSGGCESWTFWQYSARGRVDGVDGPVDLDAYCGDEASFERLGQSPGEEQP